jgi:hypothetical protein
VKRFIEFSWGDYLWWGVASLKWRESGALSRRWVVSFTAADIFIFKKHLTTELPEEQIPAEVSID